MANILRLKLIPLIGILSISLTAFSQTCQNPGARMERIKSQLSNKDTIYQFIRRDLQFIQPTKHDTMADIGTYDGFYPLAYSLFSDSIVFYLNDIKNDGFIYYDSIKTLCEKTKDLTNQFKIVLGNDSTTNLWPHQFNKIVLRDVLHHFKDIDKMLADIKRIMKPGATLMLFEPIKAPINPNKNLCKGAVTRAELILLLTKNGFKLTRQLEMDRDSAWFAFTP